MRLRDELHNSKVQLDRVANADIGTTGERWRELINHRSKRPNIVLAELSCRLALEINGMFDFADMGLAQRKQLAALALTSAEESTVSLSLESWDHEDRTKALRSTTIAWHASMVVVGLCLIKQGEDLDPSVLLDRVTEDTMPNGEIMPWDPDYDELHRLGPHTFPGSVDSSRIRRLLQEFPGSELIDDPEIA